MEENRINEGLRLINLAAEKNLSDAQFILARIHMDKAINDKQHYTSALKWLKNAADQEHVEAMHYMGLFYSSGEAIEKNMPEAVKWWEKAAEKGHKEAQYFLAQAIFNE